MDCGPEIADIFFIIFHHNQVWPGILDVQIRNTHNLLQDMAEEVDLYAKAGELVKLLISWDAPNGMKLPDLIVNLGQLMADKGFWEQVNTNSFWSDSCTCKDNTIF